MFGIVEHLLCVKWLDCKLRLFTATNSAPSLHIPIGLNFLFRNFDLVILRAKFRNWAMLFHERLIELSDTNISFERIFCLTV